MKLTKEYIKNFKIRFFRRMVALFISIKSSIATNNVFYILPRVALCLPWVITFKAYSLKKRPVLPFGNSQVRSAWYKQEYKYRGNQRVDLKKCHCMPRNILMFHLATEN